MIEERARYRQCTQRWSSDTREGKACLGAHYEWGRVTRDQIVQAKDACLAQVETHTRAAAQAKDRQIQAERQRVTTIPIEPVMPPQRSVVVPNPYANAARQQQTEAAVQLAGSLIAKMFEAGVEKRFGEAKPNDVSKRVEEDNARAFQIFEKARDRMNVHPVVKMVQDMAFEQVSNQVRVVTEQFSNLERSIDQITASVPAESTVLRARQVTLNEVRLEDWKSGPVRYEGQVDGEGKPHGLGVFTGKSAHGWPAKHFGNFVAGRIEGWGTFQDTSPDGSTVFVEAQWKEGDAPGGVIEKTVAADGRRSIYRGPDPLEQKNGSTAVGRIDFVEGTQYTGEIMFTNGGTKKTPYGLGRHTSADRSKTVSGNFDGSIVRTATIHVGAETASCTMVEISPAIRCVGAYKLVQPDGSYYIQRELSASSSSTLVLISRAARDGQPAYMDEMGSVIHGDRNVRRRTWGNGHVYEGEFVDDRWAAGTVGMYTFPNGVRQVGKFDDRKLVDGIVEFPDGSRKPVGHGTQYAPLRIAPQ